MAKFLDKIESPKDLQQLSIAELKELTQEIREYIIECVSKTGGHLASNLGLVEATVAMHYVFDFKVDKLLFDVGHQCYTHKILTGRKDLMKKLRTEGGITGFPNPDESPYDQFSVGHAGTAISTALGMAMGSQLQKKDDKIVAIVGDASIVNGLSFEALNNIGLVKRQMLIVLNDNSMAIDVTQGAMAKYFSKIRLSHTYEDLRKTTNAILEHVPLIGKKVEGAIERFKKTLRMAFSASQLFESLNIAYFGPVDGHDVGALVELFTTIKELDRPVILHIYTKKGKGFDPADLDPKKYHSTGPFEINGEAVNGLVGKETFTDVFSDALLEAGKKDEKVVAITAAMPDGTGVVKFREKFPNRCFDVGIAESVAVDIAAGMAKQGLKPAVCIYSTFLQRSYDQIFQEVCLQNLPVIFCIDRAGFVGSDGPTHHGTLDISFLRSLPNMTLLSPANESEVYAAMDFAIAHNGPSAIRYPKDAIWKTAESPEILRSPFELGKSVSIADNNSDITILAYGSVLKQAFDAAEILKQQNIKIDIINARFAKPLDEKIFAAVKTGKHIITVEDNSLIGGFGSGLLEECNRQKISTDKIICLGGPDRFVDVASRGVQLEETGIGTNSIADCVKKILNRS
jgi:1-deoxy-D-xylulose-5-phosphate synthase